VPLTAQTAAQPDEELIARVRAGETRLFETIMRRYNQRLFRAARAIVRDDAEAEDVLQEAWTRTFAHLDQFRGEAAFPTWITRIAVHEALARTRRGRVVVPTDDEELEAVMPRTGAWDPERQAHDAELRRLLEQAIDALPEIYRAVFVLRELEGLDTAETAACLEVTDDVVKTRLSRARALLRDALYQRAGLVAAEAFAFDGARCDRIVAAVLARIRG
jgi:RNA polymerase sigma-70 factor (ECF subfamily)